MKNTRTAKIALAAMALVLVAAVLAVFARPSGLLHKTWRGQNAWWTSDPESVRRILPPGEVAPPPPWVEAEKPAGTRRVVLLGGSVAAGVPMPDYNLARVVQALWRARFPSEPVEVVNLALPGAGPQHLRDLARAAMALDPDMLVVHGPERGMDDAAADFRAIAETARRHDAKALFCLPATEDTVPEGMDGLSKIAGEMGEGVAAVDAGKRLREFGPTASARGGFFLDGEHLSFAGRAAVAGMIADGMAALWGLAPRGRGAVGVDAALREFVGEESRLRRDLMFTGYDEHDMWSLAAKRLRREAGGGARRAERLAAAEEAALVLQRRAALGCSTTDIVVAYDRAALQSPDDPLAHFAAGRLLGARGEGERAEEAFRRGFALQPNNADARLNYAAMQLARGDAGEASASLDALAEFDSRAPGAAKIRAAIAARGSDWAGAAALLEKHLRQSPDDASAWLMLADLQMRLGEFDAAEQSRQRAKACE